MHPCLHYFIVIVSESLLHSQILIWRYVSMQNKRHDAAHTLNGVKARLSHSIKGITWISLWTSWYCKAFVSYKSRLRSFFFLNYKKSPHFWTWAICNISPSYLCSVYKCYWFTRTRVFFLRYRNVTVLIPFSLLIATYIHH